MMLKSQLEDKLTTIFKIEQELCQKVVFSIVESISTAINENDRVEIRGFGSFFKKNYSSYKGRNPKTGESVMVPEKNLPLFRPSKDLISKLNKF
jgi:integration host factor subunit beta|tara:strand:- start:14203 stop:14484 length:282 start_codon:yes stop_codon:yes gene_type:complete